MARLLAQADGDLRGLVTGKLNQFAGDAGYGSDPRSLYDVVGGVISLLLGLAAVLFLIQVVHGGFMWMTAGGNDAQIKSAKQKITNGAIGIAIVFGAFMITYLITSIISNEANVPAGFVQ